MTIDQLSNVCCTVMWHSPCLSSPPPSLSLTPFIALIPFPLSPFLPLLPHPQVMKVDNTKYTILYSIYSWPNVILSIFGGFLLDRVFGIRIGTVVFSAFICIGQFVFALGGIVNKFWVMIVGRFIFGWVICWCVWDETVGRKFILYTMSHYFFSSLSPPPPLSFPLPPSISLLLHSPPHIDLVVRT